MLSTEIHTATIPVSPWQNATIHLLDAVLTRASGTQREHVAVYINESHARERAHQLHEVFDTATDQQSLMLLVRPAWRIK